MFHCWSEASGSWRGEYLKFRPVGSKVAGRFKGNPAEIGVTVLRSVANVLLLIATLPAVEEGGSFLYVFNYSVVPALRGTAMAARLLKALADDIARTPHRGLAALTVSPEGERVAARFGMTARARAEGAHDAVFTCRTA